MILKTEAIVLKSFDFRETSRIVTFLTKSYGKIKGVLKGIRKDPKRFGSSVDRFSINDIVYYPSRHSELHLISQCDLKSFFPPIRKDLKKMMAAHYTLELVGAIMPLEERNEEVYQLMLDYFFSLEGTLDINKLIYIFQVKILLLSGFKPHLDSCLTCGRKIMDKARFSLKSGGLICLYCPLNERQVAIISRGTISSILHMEKNNWHESLRLGVSEKIKKELKYVLNNFLVYHLERHLKTQKYLS